MLKINIYPINPRCIMEFDKILTVFACTVLGLLLDLQTIILSLFFLVLIAGVAKLISAFNDDDIKWYQVCKMLARSNTIPFILYSFTGYSIALLSTVMLELVFFGQTSVMINDTNINLTYLVLLICISNVFHQIVKSVEDIVRHKIYDKIINEAPKWLADLLKRTKDETKTEVKEKNDTN